MHDVGKIVREVHSLVREKVRPGATTRELDTYAHELCRKFKVEPAFLNYPSNTAGVIPFPGVLCVSKNEVIVHGIPDDVPLKEGDILSVDFGCSYKGYFGDSAYTYALGKISDKAQELLQITEASLAAAIEQCVPGKRIGDISYAVQNLVEPRGFGVVRDFVGHGIGKNMHEPPHVPNFGNPAQGRLLRPGMVIAIEPMVTAGTFSVKILADGWTAVTADGSLSAHFEHTVAVTENGPLILT